MTITKKPKLSAVSTVPTDEIQPTALPVEEAPTPDSFIQAAEHSIPALTEPDSISETVSAESIAKAVADAVPTDPGAAKKAKGKDKDKKKDKKKKDKDQKKKEAVLIRFDDTQLVRIDASAAALGLSRAAWVRMVVAQALPPLS